MTTARTENGLLSLYNDRRILIMALIGFSCGIPLFLTASTLSLWLKQSGSSYTTVGLIGWVAFPYTIKFLWAPFIDRLKIPFLTKTLGRRRSWLLASQLCLMLSIYALSIVGVNDNLMLTVVCALCVSFFSATQDVVMLAYQVERLGRNQFGAGEAMGIFGYRMGMLLSGAGALYLAESMTWQGIYQIMAAAIVVGVITTFAIKEPSPIITDEMKTKEKSAEKYLHSHPKIPHRLAIVLSWLYGAVVCPFSNFMMKKGWFVCILIMLLYKLGDNLIGNMANIFYIEMGFSKSEIASVSKIFGMATTIIGGFLGGYLTVRLGILKSLFISGLVHGASILFFVLIAKVGYNLDLLYLSIAIEHITGGMRTTSLFAFQMTLVNPIYAATQLALLTSAVHFGRVATSSISGWMIEHLGWVKFFSLCSASTIVGLILVVMYASIEKNNNNQLAYAR